MRKRSSPWWTASARISEGGCHGWITRSKRATHWHSSRRPRANSPRNEGLTLGIWCGGELSGTIGTHKIDWLNRRVEFGYWIASDLQGRGIMTEACRAVIRHAFEEWRLNRVEIHCATGNQKSCAIPERLGFRFEGTSRQAQLVNGDYYDIRVYAILAEEWNHAR